MEHLANRVPRLNPARTLKSSICYYEWYSTYVIVIVVNQLNSTKA